MYDNFDIISHVKSALPIELLSFYKEVGFEPTSDNDNDKSVILEKYIALYYIYSTETNLRVSTVSKYFHPDKTYVKIP